MIKTILVPATGSPTDDGVFATALVVARAFESHLDFLHVPVDAAALAATMAVDGSGAALMTGLIERIDEDARQREETARQLFQRFCEREHLVTEDSPAAQPGPSTQWHQQTGDEAYWVTECGRSADLLVIGRPAEGQGVSVDTIETALVGSGRPVLIPSTATSTALPETIVIAWKAAPEAARAVTAAMPFLAKAKQILIVTIADAPGISDEEGARLMTSLRWHRFNASTRHVEPDPRGAADTLLAVAEEHGALVVMGAYGHSRLRQWILGGFTHHVIRGAAVPVLMMH
jgi:nucleotide-binding universal stress UspA family protein